MMSEDCKYRHEPVLFGECMDLLAIRPEGTYVDCTAGGGGHSYGIMERLGPKGRLVSLDKDPAAVAQVTRRIGDMDAQAGFQVLRQDFSDLDAALDQCGIEQVDGILADLGVSSHQLDIVERGFSYSLEGPLDMRMNPDAELTAALVVGEYSAERLVKIFRLYGEERYAGRIARAICRRRGEKPFENTADLANVIASAMPPQARREAQHPAKRVFQAIRIEVNGELESLRILLAAAIARLSDNGRLCVISFHSLEDRLVKEAFRSWENPCTCPRDFPRCVCGAVPLGKAVSRRPVTAKQGELERNPRARSAKLRTFERHVITD